MKSSCCLEQHTVRKALENSKEINKIKYLESRADTLNQTVSYPLKQLEQSFYIIITVIIIIINILKSNEKWQKHYSQDMNFTTDNG